MLLSFSWVHSRYVPSFFFFSLPFSQFVCNIISWIRNERTSIFFLLYSHSVIVIYTHTCFVSMYIWWVCLFCCGRFEPSKRLFDTTGCVWFCGQLVWEIYFKKKEKKEVGLFTWCSRMELEIHPWSCVCCLTPRHTYYFGCCGSGNVPASDWWFSTWSSDASMCCVPPCWGSRRTGSPGTPESNKETNSFVSFFYYTASFTRIFFNDTLIHHFVSVFGGDDLI